MDKKTLRPLLEAKCAEEGFHFPTAAALVEVVSSWNPDFCVFGANYTKSNLLLKAPTGVTSDTEFIHQRTRWGLFGLYGYEARRLHFTGWLSSLLRPDIGIVWGLKHLKKLQISYEGSEIIAAFNFGFPRRDGERFVNQGFVDRVEAARPQFETLKGVSGQGDRV